MEANRRLRLSLQPVATFNYPPVVHPREQPTLALAAARLHLHIRQNNLQQAGFGIFTTRAFKEGETVGYMWGKITSAEVWSSIAAGADPTHLSGQEDFVATCLQGVNCCVAIDEQADGSSVLIASRLCPMAFINHGEQLMRNVSVMCMGRGQLPAGEADRSSFFPVVTTRAIKSGEELLTDYAWTEETWRTVKARMRRSPAYVSSTQQADFGMDKHRSVCEGAPSRERALKVQSSNLRRFVQDNHDKFQRYEPWTRTLPGLPQPSTTVRVADSLIFAGLRATFTTEPISWHRKRDTVLTEYPGVLMNDQMLSRFNAEYHCPTTVRVNGLDYNRVKMNLVGDPIHPGPTINDGGHSAQPSQ